MTQCSSFFSNNYRDCIKATDRAYFFIEGFYLREFMRYHPIDNLFDLRFIRGFNAIFVVLFWKLEYQELDF